MKSSTSDKVEGEYHKAKGKVKEKTGELINDSNMEAEGEAENIEGKVQKKKGEIKDVFGK